MHTHRCCGFAQAVVVVVVTCQWASVEGLAVISVETTDGGSSLGQLGQLELLVLCPSTGGCEVAAGDPDLLRTNPGVPCNALACRSVA